MHSQSLFSLSQTCHKFTFATFTASEIKQNTTLSAADMKAEVTLLYLNSLKGKKIIWSSSSESCK